MKHRFFTFHIALFTCLATMAQLDNTVEVTNEVKPVVTDVKKVDVKTKQAETKVTHHSMQYAVEGQTLNNYAPEYLGDYESEAVKKGNKKGYVHLGGGSHGNIDGLVTYQFDLTDNDALGIDFSLKGFNGKTKDSRYFEAKDWKSRDYHNRLAVNYIHRFDNGLTLFAQEGYENRLFNYRGGAGTTDKQHDVMGNALVGFAPFQMNDFTLSASVGVNSFVQGYKTNLGENLKEETYKADADLSYRLAEDHNLGLGFGFFGSTFSNDELKGIGRFRFTPHYIYETELMKWQLGIFVSTKGNVAPDVTFTYHINPVSDFYAAARGYERDNDMRRLSNIHPYFTLNVPKGPYANNRLNMNAEFHQVDVRAGYRFKPIQGFGGHLNLGYDISKNAPDLYWITNSLDGRDFPLMNFSKEKRFYINADFTYAYTDIVKVEAKHQLNFTSRKEQSDEKWRSGSSITPLFDMNWTLNVKLLKDLYFDVDWQYATFKEANLGVVPSQYDRPNTANLGASLRYTLPIDLPLTIFAKGDNLLNKKYDRYFGYRNIGANFLAGFALSF